MVRLIVDNHLAKGEIVMVHCMAGRGRSGTFAAACLIYKGVKAEDAIPLVRLYRPGAI